MNNQLNQEFDRIWGLIVSKFEKINDPESLINMIEIFHTVEHFQKLTTVEKREILITIFTAKEKNGGYVLKEGDLENSKFKSISNKRQNTIGLRPMEDAFMNGSNEHDKGYYTGVLQYIPKNIRSLFLQNCILENDQEIDKQKIKNLKLITWQYAFKRPRK